MRNIICCVLIITISIQCSQKKSNNYNKKLSANGELKNSFNKKVGSSIILIIQNDKDSIKESEVMYDTISKQKEGLAKLYYKNGQLKQEGMWHNNKQEGVWTFYNNDGTISSVIFFVNDNQDGLSVFYNNQGSITEKTNWKNGEINGDAIEYYDNGKIKRVTSWSNGVKVSEKKYIK